MTAIWDTMTFSAMQRHVMIFTLVSQSDALLSAADRLTLIQDLMSQPIRHDAASIELKCQELADLNLGVNMTDAQILRSAYRGY